jgi:hypothetical protein
MGVEEEVGQYLQAQGLGILGRTLFLFDFPQNPDQIIWVKAYTGSSPLTAHDTNDGIGTERPRFQVAVRAARKIEAETLATQVYKKLALVRNQVISGVFYQRIMVLAPPSDVLTDVDISNRPILRFNCEAWKEPSP